jgi:PAS domain S-box-containing protein
MIQPTYTLLIVEDFLGDREQYRRFLLKDSNCSYCILEAETAADGLKLCQTRSVDAILLDYLLPDDDGLTFLELLSAQSNGDIPPVVMMTGQGNESIAVRAMKLGAADYLVKQDLTPEILQLTMQKAIENTRLRRQLQQSGEQIKAIWESMTDAYIMLDRHYRFTYANQAATQIISSLTDSAPEEILGKSHWELFPYLIDSIVEQEYRRALTDRVAVHLEIWYEPTKNWFESHVYPFGEGLGIYFRDITDRKVAETVRIQAEQERDHFFNLSIDLLAIGDFDGYFTRLNPSAQKILGFTNAELMAQPFIDFVHPDDRQHTLAGAQNLTTGDVVVNFENRYLCKDGSYRWLAWSATPYLERNLWYAIGRDITDKKQAQAALEERNRDLDSFTHIVSHDLKAPLRAIASLSQWIEEDLEGALTEETQQQMNLLRSRVHRMENTISGLLNYARFGKIESKIESVVVAQLLAETIDSIAPSATFSIAIAPMPTFDTKRLLLSQVFANLIGNGIKHHNRSDGLIQISVQDRGDFYEFAIADDGPGIALEDRERIFTIFQSGTSQNRLDSSGIGLAIVKKIVEAETGTIRLESSLEKGTAFYFTWPKKS